ncbi:MAG TPA: hypothetical protein PKI14_14710 [Fervidobacterium sp.]|nr:hypothetical protein [Fervidobacterium sp.]
MLPAMTKREREKGFVNISFAISADTHEKIRKLSEGRGMSLRRFLQELCNWSAEYVDDPIFLIRCGISLPIWPGDKQDLTSHE